MKAMIFAAGLGTRLRPLTNDRPKALVEVAGVTMLERVIRHIAEAGFDDITINIHHFGNKIIEFLDNHDRFGLDIHISDERELLLDTGGGILQARPFLDGNEPFLVHNADILTDLDLKAFYNAHSESDAVASVLVKQRDTQRYFLLDDENRLRGWIHMGTGEVRPAGLDPSPLRHRAFGGIHVISPAIFPLLEQYAAGRKVFSITPFYIDQCDQHIFHGYEPADDYLWLDVGKPDTLECANRQFSATLPSTPSLS